MLMTGDLVEFVILSQSGVSPTFVGGRASPWMAGYHGVLINKVRELKSSNLFPDSIDFSGASIP